MLSRLPATSDIRGGADSSSPATENEEESSDNVDSLNISGILLALTKKAITTTTSTLWRLSRAYFRVAKAVFDDPETESTDLMSRLSDLMQRMWKAAVQPSSDSDGEGVAEDRDDNAQMLDANDDKDIGSYLASEYKVEDMRSDRHSTLSGSLMDALKKSRSDATLLVAVIPSSKPGKSDGADEQVIESLLSEEVASAARKQARKKMEGSSFTLWSAKAGSTHAIQALKRLDMTTSRRPVLAVLFPASALDRSGKQVIVPKVLAQHHCSPPLSSEKMFIWLNSIRKRHVREYKAMQKMVKENQFARDRQQGYVDSIKSDKEKEERIAREHAERMKKEEIEREKAAEIAARRVMLRESLPQEPDVTASNYKTLSVRLASGNSIRRRFHDDDMVSDVFNWVDVELEMDREMLELTTTNGKIKLTWPTTTDDKTLAESGLGKMVGLRATEISPEKVGSNTETDEAADNND